MQRKDLSMYRKGWNAPAIFFAFRRYFVYILSSWCLPVGRCDCLLGALKAHKETSAHDYQGWLQARPIREDIKKYFYLVLSHKIPSRFSSWLLLRFLKSSLKNPCWKSWKNPCWKYWEENFPLFQSQAPSEIQRESLRKILVKICLSRHHSPSRE